MKAFLIIMMLFGYGPARASDGELGPLIRARSVGQLSKIVADSKLKAHIKLVCDAQLRGNRVPTACFRWLRFEDSKRGEWLDSLCLSRVAKTHDRRELEAAASADGVPEACRAVARERAADLLYADQAERPADVFWQDENRTSGVRF